MYILLSFVFPRQIDALAARGVFFLALSQGYDQKQLDGDALEVVRAIQKEEFHLLRTPGFCCKL